MAATVPQAVSTPGAAVERVSLHVVVDDAPGAPGLVSEHGFSCWVATEHGAILFDTGLGHALLGNARRLGLSLGDARALVLSHGHYDHTGGLAPLLLEVPIPRVVAHPAFDGPHRSRSTGADRDAGVPDAGRLALASVVVERSREPTEVVPGVWATGEIPRSTDEDVGGPFFTDRGGRFPDPLLDDQALVVRHQAGLVILLGCAHAGVRNTLRHARRLFPGVPIRGVLGGMHLHSASPARLEATLGELAAGDALVGPAHCTGEHAKAVLQAGLGSRFCRVVVGSILELGRDGDFRCRDGG